LADDSGLRWLYPYLEDADSTRLGLPVFRPYVPISIVGPAGSSVIYDGLIDTGSDAILTSALVADYIGLDLEDHDGETTHAVAGAIMTARYKTVPPAASPRQRPRHVRGVGNPDRVHQRMAEPEPDPARQRRLPRPMDRHRQQVLAGGGYRGCRCP